MDQIIFIGTGSGDHTMLSQQVKTSAIYLELDNNKIIIDPGPGTIVNAVKLKINLDELNGLIVTHPHPDHYADANCLIDALKKPNTFLIAGKKCLVESESYYPCINKYQQKIPQVTKSIDAGEIIKINNLSFQGVPTNHTDCGLGIKIVGSKRIGYVGNGSCIGAEKWYPDMDLLIFDVMTPHNRSKYKGIHTSSNEVIEIANKVRPKKIIIQHYSEEMLKAGRKKEAQIIEKATKIKTIAATDGMKLKL